METSSEGNCEEAIEMAETESKQDSSEKETKISISMSNNGAVNTFTDTKELLKWDRMAVILAFTALMSLLSVSYFSISNEKFFPKTFKNQWSYAMFLMVINAAFYFPITGFLLRQKHPKIGKAFSVIAFLSLIVSFTLLSWKLLPSCLNWVPWILGVFTVGALICQVLPDFPWN